MISLETQDTPEGVKCTYKNGELVGTPVGLIKYVPKHPLNKRTWEARPDFGGTALPVYLTQPLSFRSRVGAEYYMLAMAEERMLYD